MGSSVKKEEEMERETKCIQAGYVPKNGESRMIPIVQSTTFKYDTSEDMGKLFDLEAEGYFYTRLQNPTNDYVAAKICACSRLPDRRHPFILFLIYAAQGIMSFPPLRFMGEPTIYLP